MDWWKKTAVPATFKQFSASYRYGFADAAQGKKKQQASWFTYVEAFDAYKAGYEAGLLKKKELEDEARGE